MSHFSSSFIAEAVDGGWRLNQELVYHSDLLGCIIEVPIDYVTDLASVPRIARFIVPVANAKNRKAAVVHDYLCTHGVKLGLVRNQKQTDKVFREALGVVGVGRIRSAALYYPVRTFQWCKGLFT